MSEEIRLKKTILDAVLSLLSGMEFSQEEGSIELEIMEAKKGFKMPGPSMPVGLVIEGGLSMDRKIREEARY